MASSLYVRLQVVLSPDTESWVHVGRLDNRIWGLLMTLCTGELAALTREYESLHVKLLSVKNMYCRGGRKFKVERPSKS